LEKTIITISVVIPAYNAEKYLGRAIRSVLGQTYPADEIIVVDDGSKDNTRVVAEAFGEAVRYYYQSNQGASAARNFGIQKAEGDWIAFLDADDEWFEERLSKQVGVLEKEPWLQWMTGNYVTRFLKESRPQEEHLDSQRAKVLLAGRVFWENYFDALVLGATGWTGTMLIRKELLEQAGLFRMGQASANDLDMWWRVAFLEPKIGYVPEPIAVYSLGVEGSITQRYTRGEIIGGLLSRYVNRAIEVGQWEHYKRCVRYLGRYWIQKFLATGRMDDVQALRSAVGAYMPYGYRLLLGGLCFWPSLTVRILPGLKRVNRLLGGRI
jgi:glycosyltransferase involved in cell wall biosynthesis